MAVFYNLSGLTATKGSVTLPCAGQFTSANNSAVKLTDNTRDTTPCSEILFVAAVGNTGTIAIGNEEGQFVVLAAGDSILIGIARVSALMVKASAAAQVLNWLGRS